MIAFGGRRGPHRSGSRCRGRPIERREAGREGCLWPNAASQGRPPDGSGGESERSTQNGRAKTLCGGGGGGGGTNSELPQAGFPESGEVYFLRYLLTYSATKHPAKTADTRARAAPGGMGVPGMTIRVLGMGAGGDAGAASTDAGATSTLDASAYGGPPFEPTIFTNFLVLCCTPVMQVFLINLVLGLVAFAVRSMQWVVFGRLRAAEWQVPSAT